MTDDVDLLMAAGIFIAQNRDLKRQLSMLKRSRGRIFETVHSNDAEKFSVALQPLRDELQRLTVKLDRFGENLPLEREALQVLIKTLKTNP